MVRWWRLLGVRCLAPGLLASLADGDSDLAQHTADNLICSAPGQFIGGYTVRFLLATCPLAIAACAQPASPPPVQPTGDATPCSIIQAVDQNRLIREPDGAAFNRPCPEAGVDE